MTNQQKETVKRFKKIELDKNDHRKMDIAATITRIVFAPIIWIIKLIMIVWNYDLDKD